VVNVPAAAFLAFETVDVAWPRTSPDWHQVWAASIVAGVLVARPADGR